VKTIESAHDVFWLARYAHNTLDPLVKAAKQYDPTIQWSIELVFADKDSHFAKDNHIDLKAHWKRDRPIMLFQSTHRYTKADVDAVAAKVQAFIDAQQAILEAEHDAEALYAIEQADILAAQDWEYQQERRAERADIERDEHDHDIELQNEMAGN
jgi:hypothetical protein